jgi:hypothetical protein
MCNGNRLQLNQTSISTYREKRLFWSRGKEVTMHIIHPLRVNAGIVGFNFNGKVVVVESFEVGAHFGEISLGTVEMSKIGTTPFLEGCFCQILNQIVRRGILSDCLVAFKRDSFMDDSLRRFAHNMEDKDCLVCNDSFIHNDCNLRSERKKKKKKKKRILLPCCTLR